MAFSLGFSEKNQVLSHDFLLYIQGVDVSAYVQGSISWSIVGLGGENQLNCTLDNAHDRWVITDANVKGNWRNTKDVEFSEREKHELYKFKQNSDINPIDYATTGEPRWSLVAGRVILHKYDPIRLFVQDPYGHGWMPAFTGYMIRAEVSDDWVTGLSNVTISASDIRERMQHMRVQLNPVAGMDGHARLEPIFENAGDFSDLLRKLGTTNEGGAFNDRYAKLKYEDVVATLITGENASYSENRRAQSAVGSFSIGGTFYIEPQAGGKFTTWFLDEMSPDTTSSSGSSLPAKGNASLEYLHRIMLFGRVKGELVGYNSDSGKSENVEVDADFWSKKNCQIVGKETKTGGVFTPSSCELFFLLPKGGTPWSSIVEVAIDSLSGQRTWGNRTDLLREYTENVGYSWTVTPFGDMVFEFNQYDFLPSFYGSNFSAVYRYDDHLVQDSFGDEVGSPPAAVVVVGGYDYRLGGGAGDAHAANIPRAWVKSNIIAARFGTNIETITFPFTEDLDQLCLMAALHYGRKLAEANELSFSGVYRPYLLPNRPVEVVPRKRMATIMSVNHTLNINEDASTEVDVQYVRHKDKFGNYRLLTGSVQGPVSYVNYGGLIASSASTEQEIKDAFLSKSLQTLQPRLSTDPTIQVVPSINADTGMIDGVNIQSTPNTGMVEGIDVRLVPKDYTTFCENIGKSGPTENTDYVASQRDSQPGRVVMGSSTIPNAGQRGSAVGMTRAQAQAMADKYTDGDLEVFLLATMIESEDTNAAEEHAHVYFNQKRSPVCAYKMFGRNGKSSVGDPWVCLVQNRGTSDATMRWQASHDKNVADKKGGSEANANWATGTLPTDASILAAKKVKEEREGPGADLTTYPNPKDPTNGALSTRRANINLGKGYVQLGRAGGSRFWIDKRCHDALQRRNKRITGA